MFNIFQTGSMSSMIPSLVKLDATSSDLLRDLKLLDSLSVRTADTVNIFYVKTGQTKMNDILNNVVKTRFLFSRLNSF